MRQHIPSAPPWITVIFRNEKSTWWKESVSVFRRIFIGCNLFGPATACLFSMTSSGLFWTVRQLSLSRNVCRFTIRNLTWCFETALQASNMQSSLCFLHPEVLSASEVLRCWLEHSDPEALCEWKTKLGSWVYFRRYALRKFQLTVFKQFTFFSSYLPALKSSTGTNPSPERSNALSSPFISAAFESSHPSTASRNWK